ncbi:MAG: hypothetical protein ACKOBW_01355 [Planctomycetota bacterium]
MSTAVKLMPVAGFARSQSLQAEGTADEILAQVRWIRAKAAQLQARRGLLLLISIVAFVLAGVSLLANMFRAVTDPLMMKVTLWSTVAFLVTAVAVLIYRQRQAKTMIDLRRIDIIEHLLQSLSLDMKPTTKINARFDFRHHRHPDLLRRKNASFWQGTSLSGSQIPWLSLSAVLIDRQRITLSLTQTFTSKDTQKRKYSKRVESFRERLKVTARVNPATYPGLAEIGIRAIAARIHGPFRNLSWKVDGEKVSVQCDLPKIRRTFGRGMKKQTDPPSGLMQHQHVLDVLVALYQALGHCRQAKAGRGAKHGR